MQQNWSDRFRCAEADLDTASDDAEALAIALQRSGASGEVVEEAIDTLYDIQGAVAALAQRLSEVRKLVLGG